MGLSCRIIYKNGVASVFNADGTPSELYAEALKQTGNQEDALNIWAVAYTDEYVASSSLEGDSATFESVMSFLDARESRRKTLTPELRNELKAAMRANGFAGLSELHRALVKVFKPKGIATFSETEVSKKIYSAEDLREIDTDKVDETITAIEGELAKGKDITVTPDKAGGRSFSKSDKKSPIGTNEKLTSEEVEQEIIAGIKDFSNAQEVDKAVDNHPFKDAIDSPGAFKSFLKTLRRIPVVTYNGVEVTEDNLNTTRETITTIKDSAERVLKIELITLNKYSDEVWAEKKDAVKRIISEMEAELSLHGVDIIGLSKSNPSRQDMIDMFSSLVEFLETSEDTAIRNFATIKDKYVTPRANTVVRNIDPAYNGLDIVYSDTLFPDNHLFETEGLIRVGENLYHRIDRENNDMNKTAEEVYNMFLDGQINIPTEVEDIQDPNNKEQIIKDIFSYAAQMNTGYKTNHNVEVALLQMAFAHKNYEKKNHIQEVGHIKTKKDYLKNQFVGKFYDYVLKEKLKDSFVYRTILSKFKFNENGISLDGEVNSIEDISMRDELVDYIRLRRESDMKHLLPSMVGKGLPDVIVGINNPDQVPEYTSVTHRYKDYVITASTRNNLIKLNGQLYRKAAGGNGMSVFIEVDMTPSPFYNLDTKAEYDKVEVQKIIEDQMFSFAKPKKTAEERKEQDKANKINPTVKKVTAEDLQEKKEVDALTAMLKGLDDTPAITAAEYVKSKKLGNNPQLIAKVDKLFNKDTTKLVAEYLKQRFGTDISILSNEDMKAELSARGYSSPTGSLDFMARVSKYGEGVEVKKGTDYEFDGEWDVLLNGNKLGTIYYSREQQSWIDGNFDRSSAKPYTSEWIYGGILEGSKEEAVSEFLSKYSKPITKIETVNTKEQLLNQLENSGEVSVNPLSGNYIFNGEVEFEIKYNPNIYGESVYLTSIRSFDAGKGSASRFMEELIRSADKNSITLTLEAKPFGKRETNLDMQNLVSFYSKYGFKPDPEWLGGDFSNDQEMIDYAIAEDEALPMIRQPKDIDFLSTNDKVYGFYDGATGKIFLTEEFLNSNALIHEHWHAFKPLLKQKAAKGDTDAKLLLETISKIAEDSKAFNQAEFEARYDAANSVRSEWAPGREGKGDKKILERNNIVQQAAKDLQAGKITNEQYRDIVKTNSPIKPITTFFAAATKDQIVNALNSNKVSKVDTPVQEGKMVALRLDIPAYQYHNTWVVTVHDAKTNKDKGGSTLSYSNVARITNVTFNSSADRALKIATGSSKDPFIRINGNWKNFEGKTLEEKGREAEALVDEIKDNPEWVQVGTNPFRQSFFYDRANGLPVKTAAEVVQIGGLVYAKNVEYGNLNDPEYTVKGLKDAAGKPVQFSVLGEQGAERLEGIRRLDNLEIAKQLETKGEDAQKIKLLTEWERGADGKWKYEVSNKDFNLNPKVKFEKTTAELFDNPIEITTLADLVTDNVLFKAYPGLKDSSVIIYKNEDKFAEAEMFNLGNDFFINGEIFTTADIKSQSALVRAKLLHEVQHNLQTIEGFSDGTNVDNVRSQLQSIINRYSEGGVESIEGDGKFKSASKILQRTFGEETVEGQMQLLSNDWIVEYIANGLYTNNAGEVEARNVESRLGLTEEQLRTTLLSDTADVSVEDQDILFSLVSPAGQLSSDVYNPRPGESKEDYIDRMREEVEANLLGVNSEEYFKRIAEENRLTPAETKSFLAKIKAFIDKFSFWLSKQLGFQNITPEQASKLTTKEALDRITTSMLRNDFGPLNFEKVFEKPAEAPIAKEAPEDYFSTNEKGEQVVSLEKIKDRLPKAYETLKKYLREPNLNEFRNIVAGEYTKTYKYKVEVDKSIEVLKELEKISTEVDKLKPLDFISKEEFLQETLAKGEYTAAQKEIMKTLILSLNTDRFPKYATNKSLKEAGIKRTTADNFYIPDSNVISAGNPAAFVHEIGHFAFGTVLSPEDRIAFLEYASNKFYGKGAPSLKESIAATSEPITFMRDGKMYSYRTNVADNFDEYFAEQFSQWYLGEKVAPEGIRSMYQKVADYLNKIIEKLISKKYIDKELVPFFEKIVKDNTIQKEVTTPSDMFSAGITTSVEISNANLKNAQEKARGLAMLDISGFKLLIDTNIKNIEDCK